MTDSFLAKGIMNGPLKAGDDHYGFDQLKGTLKKRDFKKIQTLFAGYKFIAIHSFCRGAFLPINLVYNSKDNPGDERQETSYLS